MSEIRDNLLQILDDLIVNTGVSSSSLITEDGLVLAINTEQNEQDEEVNTNFAAISASILSMAERGIEIINENKMLEQIKIDAGFKQNLEEDFTIMISRISTNILLQVIFARTVNVGLIHFEINKSITEIRNLVQTKNIDELFDNIGSLL